jgi:hypothetical protein
MFLNGVVRFHGISVLQFHGAKLSGPMFLSQEINHHPAPQALLPQGPM